MAKIGDKVKYSKPDAYPGYKPPTEITPGDIYTIKDFREAANQESAKRPGDFDYQFEEVKDSWYGSKRFEPVPKTSGSQPTTHKGIFG